MEALTVDYGKWSDIWHSERLKWWLYCRTVVANFGDTTRTHREYKLENADKLTSQRVSPAVCLRTRKPDVAFDNPYAVPAYVRAAILPYVKV